MHYLCWVIGDNPDRLLKPFQEYGVSNMKMKFFIPVKTNAEDEFLSDKIVQSLPKLDRLPKSILDYNEESDFFIFDGDIYRFDNPNGHYDDYTIGGAWEGCIHQKDGKQVSQSLSTDIDFDKIIFDGCALVFKRNGKSVWLSKSDDEKAFDLEFQKIIADLKKRRRLVTVFDCHT